ncbi:MAG: DUF6145 family protein [Eubacteriales bacterium]|jgi:hypothetical protein
MERELEEKVLCGANGYNKKYFFNDEFSILPKKIQDELKIICVTFTENCGGIITLEFNDQGSLVIRTQAEENDAMYDDINAGLEVKKIQEDRQELFEDLELFYKMFNEGAF